jgi:hypothetical protein
LPLWFLGLFFGFCPDSKWPEIGYHDNSCEATPGLASLRAFPVCSQLGL